jgi:hypothetical protein
MPGQTPTGRHHLGQRQIGGIAQCVAPEIQHPLRRLRRNLPGQPFPSQQCQRLVDRQLILASHPVVTFRLAFLSQLRLQIAPDAIHVAGADDFHPHLLQRVVGVLRLPPRRHTLSMHAIVMMAQAQRDRIGLAAQLGHLGRRQCARRQWQPGALAGQTGRSRLERHLHVRLFGYCPQHARRRALEILGARVVFRGPAPDKPRFRPDPAYANLRVVNPPVGMSSLKQR